MRIESLLPHQIETDPNNVRCFFKGISDLADSIAEYDLLENLVVKEGEIEGNYVIVAGERRFRAINELIADGRRSEKEELIVVVVDGDGTFENIVENLCRDEVSIWDYGFRFSELVEAGYTQTDIAARCGKGQGYVSRCVAIAKGLHPSAVEQLNNLTSILPNEQLLRIASLKDGDGKPDKEAQRREIELQAGLRKNRRRKPSKRTDLERMTRRFMYMQTTMLIPSHAQPYVDAVVSYLGGSVKKIKFPEEL